MLGVDKNNNQERGLVRIRVNNFRQVVKRGFGKMTFEEIFEGDGRCLQVKY